MLLALCAALPLWQALLGGVIGPFDQVRHMAPWNGPPASRPWDVLQADSVLQFYPWRDMVFDAWGKGQIPAWNPYELAGTPLLANSQSGGFYPLHILAGVLHLATGWAITLLAWFHLFWAGFGTYFLARKVGAIRTGAALAGVAFQLSPFLLAWAALASVPTTVAWIPWILALTVDLYAPGTGRAKRRKAAALAVCVAMMLLAGHLQFCSYGIMGAVLAAVWMAIASWVKAARGGCTDDKPAWLPAGKATILVMLACLLGAMLAGPQLLPVLIYGRTSHRSNTPSEQGYAAYVGGAIPAIALQSLALPTALGNPTKSIPIMSAANGYWPAWIHPGLNFAETALGLGPVVFLLLFFLRRPRGGSAAVAFMGVAALLLALGTPLNRLLYFGVPGWSATGSPGRAVVLFVLACCALAGIALGQAISEPKRRFCTSTSLLAVLGLWLALLPWFVPEAPERLTPLVQTLIQGEIPVFILILLVAVLCLIAARLVPRYRFIAPLAAAAVALAGYGWNLIPTSESPLSAVRGSATERYVFFNTQWNILVPPPAEMPPNTPSLSRLHELGGYDSLLNKDTVDMLKEAVGRDPAPPENGNMMLIEPNPAGNARTAELGRLAQAGVSVVWFKRPIPELGRPYSSEGGVYRYKLPGPGRAYTRLGPAQITDEGYDGLSVRAGGPARLTVKDRMMPGWSAKVDGRPAALASGLWRTVDLPSGNHMVVFRYSPPGMRNGILLAILSGLTLLLLLLQKPGIFRNKLA